MSTHNAPTLINLPPPISEPATPSDVPGTPNSGTTAISELSTVAIKDGHRGHLPNHWYSRQQPPSTSNTLEAERADRISRLAGLERVAQSNSSTNIPPDTQTAQPHGYFDNAPHLGKERSTVGSASATGSVGGRTTWASGSDNYDPDHMSVDADTSSTDGFSEEGNASLVGFGEGASSTLSGPISSVPGPRTPQRQSGVGSPFQAKANPVMPHIRDTTMMNNVEQRKGPKMVDGLAYDSTPMDANTSVPSPIRTSTRGAANNEPHIESTAMDAFGDRKLDAEGMRIQED